MTSEDVLEKSLLLLDEALNTSATSVASPSWKMQRQKYGFDSLQYSTRPSDAADLSITMNTGELSMIRNSPRTSGMLYKSSLRDLETNKPVFGSSKYRKSDIKDLSITLNPNEISNLDASATFTGRTIEGGSRFAMSRIRETDLDNLSITINPDEQSRLFETTLTGQPLVNEENGLYLAFLESLQSNQSSGEVFDTIANFAQTCSNVLDIMRENALKGHKNKFLSSKDTKWLEMERNNWRLVYCLYQNRLMNNKNSNQEEDCVNMEIGDLPNYVSEKDIVQKYYKMDNGIRECQLIVDWLEKNAVDEYEGSVKPRLGHYMDKTVAWENTLHQLQNKDIVYSSSRTIISSLDPDAPLRHGEQGHLHDLDIEDETRLLEQVFIEIRCGRLEKAQELCTYCGQSWRAATLDGWRLYHDPNYSKKSTVEKLPVEGNPNRDVWKLLAWRLAEDQRAPVFARAIHGILCGNLSSVLPVCKGWEDLLWAYTRVLVDNKVEKEIRSNMMKPYADMPAMYWNFKMTLPEIFTELAASKHLEIRQEAQSPERVLQMLLILNKVPELLKKMREWVKMDNCQPQLKRFMAHLVLILRLMGYVHKEDVGNEIVKAYVEALIQQGDPQLVAYYTATLPLDDQINMYADFLEGITDSGERRYCLEAAELVELDVEAITQRVVEKIRNKESMDNMLRLELISRTTDEDLEKISALEWVVMYPQQRAEALWQANAMIRRFLTVDKIEAARMAYNKIPMDSIEIILNQYHVENNETQLLDFDNLPNKVAVSVREFMCHKAYLDAQEGFSDWFHHFHNAKPKAPPKPKEGASFTDKVAYDHRLAQYNKELERWNIAMAHQTKNVKSQLYNVLLFPQGGWLVDLEQENMLRQQQMKSLRSLCIPKIVLLLHTVLFNMGEHTESVQLADLIISEQTKLYQVYNKQQLRELLTKLSESSLALLDQGKDAFGCPVTS